MIKLSNSEFEIVEAMKKLSPDFKDVFESPQGKRALEHLEHRFNVNDTTLSFISTGEVDDKHMLFLEGCRAVVLYITDMVEYDEREAAELLEASRSEIIDELAT